MKISGRDYKFKDIIIGYFNKSMETLFSANDNPIINRMRSWWLNSRIKGKVYSRGKFIGPKKVFKLPIECKWAVLGHNVEIQGLGKLKIGNNVCIKNNVRLDITGEIEIKDNVVIANEVVIHTHHHNFRSLVDNTARKNKLIIEEGAIISERAMILPKVKRIGKNAVIGAGSIVTKEVPDNTIVAGNPAKVIGYRT